MCQSLKKIESRPEGDVINTIAAAASAAVATSSLNPFFADPFTPNNTFVYLLLYL